jgi:hypothetical protein
MCTCTCSRSRRRALFLLTYNAHLAFCYSSTARHSAMVATAARPSAQPAIVKIRRVDALILIIRAATTTTTTTRLYAFTALFLLVDRALINIPRSRRPRPDRAHAPFRRRAFALPPPRVCLAAAARSPLHSRSFKFSNQQGAPFSPTSA